MLHHLHEHLERNGGDICAGLRTLDDVHRMTDGGTDHLGLDIRIHLEDILDVLNQGDTVGGDIIETAQERGHVGRTGPRSEQCLGCGEHQCHIRVDAFR